MAPKTLSLRQSVDCLYEVFAIYAVRADMDRCDHCVTELDVKKLVAPPLRQLGSDTVGHYSFSAMSTWGDAHDFKHFLPRLLESIVFEEYPYNVEIVGGKIRDAGWTEWPAVEKQAVAAFFEDLWFLLLSEFPTGKCCPAFPQIDDAVCMLGRVGVDLAPYLAAWARNDTVPAARNLADFVNLNAPTLATKQCLWNSFWDHPETAKEVAQWILGNSTLQKLERSFFRFSNEKFAGEISQAVENLEWARSAARRHGTVS